MYPESTTAKWLFPQEKATLETLVDGTVTLVPLLGRLGNQQAQIAQIVAGGSGYNGVSKSGEHGTGVEVGQRRLEMESKGMCAGNGGRIGHGSGRPCVAIYAVGAGAENGQPFALVGLKFQRAGHHKLLVAAACAWSLVELYGDLAD